MYIVVQQLPFFPPLCGLGTLLFHIKRKGSLLMSRLSLVDEPADMATLA